MSRPQYNYSLQVTLLIIVVHSTLVATTEYVIKHQLIWLCDYCRRSRALYVFPIGQMSLIILLRLWKDLNNSLADIYLDLSLRCMEHESFIINFPFRIIFIKNDWIIKTTGYQFRLFCDNHTEFIFPYKILTIRSKLLTSKAKILILEKCWRTLNFC